MADPDEGIPWKDFFHALKREWEEDHVMDVAGALSFAGIMALFPFLVFLVSLASLVIDPADAAALVSQLDRVAPPAVATILGDRIEALSAGGSPALLTVSALGAVWAASSGVSSLISALNTVYDVKESRPYWMVRGLSVLMTFGVAALAIAASAIAVATPALASYLGGPLGAVLLWARIPAAALLMLLVTALLYYLLPDVEQRFKLFTPGSVVAVVLWVAGSLAFSHYVKSFGRYEVVYGALGGVIVLLLWIWLSALAILLGAEINAIRKHLAPRNTQPGAWKWKQGSGVAGEGPRDAG